MDAYTCGISGIQADPTDEPEGELDDLPAGWARVVVTIRRDNPEWAEIQDGIAALAEQNLGMVPPDAREEKRPLMELVARATFAGLLDATPRYLTEEHEVHVCAEQLPTFLPYLGVAAAEDEEPAEENS